MDWKKEIKISDLKRRKHDAAAEAAAEPVAAEPKTPFWKKEIGAPRKAKQTEEKQQHTPFWKKEIGPKPKPKAASDKPESTPFWKKEISVGRKAKDSAPSDHVPFWKKEISIGRRSAAVPAAVEPEPVVVDPVATAAEIEAEVDAVVLERLARVAEAAAELEAETVAAAPHAEPETEPEPEELAVAELAATDDDGEYGWLTTELAPTPEAASWVERVEEIVDAEPLSEESVELEPVEPVAAPESIAAPETIAAPESIVAPAEEPSLPVAFSAPEPATPLPPVPLRAGVPAPLPGIHAPVRADELPPLPGEEAPAPLPEKKSALRKEISFKRKPREKAAKQAKQAKAPSDKTPFWKKEIGRKKAGAVAATAEQMVTPVADPTEEKTPFWKRELGGKRAPKEKQEKGPKRKAERAPKEKRERGAKGPRAKRTKTKGGERHKKLVGLKIGASQIAAAYVSNNGSAQLLQVAREPLEAGIVVGGELRDPDALAEALKNFFRRNKLPRRGVRLGIANNRIGVRSFDLEGIGDPKQLENAIRFRAQEALPIPIEEAVLDYQVLGERLDDEGQPVRRVLLVVAYRELIDRYVDACRKAGIRLVGIDLEAFALLRAISQPRAEGEEPPEAATVAVAVGYDRSTFAVSDGRVCEFTRVLEWGGFAINVAIARILDLAPSEAEAIKRSISLESDDVPDGLTPDQAAAVRDAMKKQVSTFARELVSSLQFYQSQPGSLSIAGITVTGGTAHLPGFGEELERLIGVPVHVGDPLARVKQSKKLKPTEQVGSFAVAIGLGIED